MTTDKEHLQWMLNRLAEVHGENRNVDYMVRMQKIIDSTKTELNLHLVSKCCDEHIEERDLYVDPSDGRMFCNQCGKTLNAEIMKMKRDKVKFNVC
tara:strand:+ start:1273 stop:1560 length:288 start_codon:yes stop_codon:yes gene_type:complete